ncbi:MAG: hypothetical protein GX661_03125, partial [Acholeplasmataceae bacterium]|nr:hypothetical protein [Acholeplasmataceae bacterium]
MKRLKTFGIVIAALLIVWVVFAIIPPKKVIDTNPFIIKDGERPLLAAHRGGKNL